MLRSSPASRKSSYLPFGRGDSSSPPPLPGFVNSSRKKKWLRSTIKSKFHENGGWKLIHSRLIKFVLFLLILLILIHWSFNTILILFKFKIIDGLFSSGWIGIGLKIRKPPLIFVQSSQSLAIVWESNKMASSSGHQLGLRYWTIGAGYQNQTIKVNSRSERRLKSLTGKVANVQRVRPEGDNGWRRWVHTALIEDLEPGTTYGYEIVLLNRHFNHQHQLAHQFDLIKKVYSKHRFTWYGIDKLDLSNGQRLSTTTVACKTPIDLINIIVIGDNQFGVKAFKTLVPRFMKIKSYMPSPKSIFGPRQIIHHKYTTPTKPNLIFHVGDAVQSIHNLKQWQTDFWDPLTFKNKLASEIPIVYAKGNHDFDGTGHNIYSGGLPKVQVGEMNRTQTAKLQLTSPLEIPGIAEADQNFTTFHAHERDPQSRGTYFAYSPHPRVRVLVCDSNLQYSRKIFPGSTISEIDEHERWLLWEMARPEWKEASIRIILVHVPPFIEFWEKEPWTEGHEWSWGQYIRTRFAPHFHALSPLTQRYDIPPASMVISGHSHIYSRGMLNNFVADRYFYLQSSSPLSPETKREARAQNHQIYDPVNPQPDNGVVYVVTGGAGGIFDRERVEDWGFYERTVLGKHHYNHLLLDMSQTLVSIEEWTQDWQDSKNKRTGFKDKKLRVYNLIGSQLVCKGAENPSQHNQAGQVWEAGHYPATDRLIWTTRGFDGRILDRFAIEAASCR